MEVKVNNKVLLVPNDFSIKLLLRHIGFSNNVAVFINGKSILMGEYESYEIKENDNIRVIKPLGGG